MLSGLFGRWCCQSTNQFPLKSMQNQNILQSRFSQRLLYFSISSVPLWLCVSVPLYPKVVQLRQNFLCICKYDFKRYVWRSAAITNNKFSMLIFQCISPVWLRLCRLCRAVALCLCGSVLLGLFGRWSCQSPTQSPLKSSQLQNLLQFRFFQTSSLWNSGQVQRKAINENNPPPALEP